MRWDLLGMGKRDSDRTLLPAVVLGEHAAMLADPTLESMITLPRAEVVEVRDTEVVSTEDVEEAVEGIIGANPRLIMEIVEQSELRSVGKSDRNQEAGHRPRLQERCAKAKECSCIRRRGSRLSLPSQERGRPARGHHRLLAPPAFHGNSDGTRRTR